MISTAPSRALLATLLLMGTAHQADAALLRCQVRYASDTVIVEARPTTDPYTVASRDIGGRFRFKAVMVGTPDQIDHIALYAYDMELPGAPVLVHEVVHKPPFAQQPKLPGFTGWNHVYSAQLGREMTYGCTLDQAAP